MTLASRGPAAQSAAALVTARTAPITRNASSHPSSTGGPVQAWWSVPSPTIVPAANAIAPAGNAAARGNGLDTHRVGARSMVRELACLGQDMRAAPLLQCTPCHVEPLAQVACCTTHTQRHGCVQREHVVTGIDAPPIEQ